MNDNLQKQFEKTGVQIPEILLPAKGTDMTKWAVVACDQFTSQLVYWQDAEQLAGNEPSTLNLILPEIYLEHDGVQDRIVKINAAMENYLSKGIIKALEPGFILVERELPTGSTRRGLVLSIDLECYDYARGSQSLVRATEATVVERIPPRVRIREGAPVELPHVMVLLDDSNKTVVEPLLEKKDTLEKLYDFELMKEGGHIRGYQIKSEDMISGIAKALDKLSSSGDFHNKYKVGPDKGVLLFAVGDGNHSLAAAKAHWETVKSGLPEVARSSHPARYALVEVVNVHDDGLVFHPINRVLFNVDAMKLVEEFKSFYCGDCKPGSVVYKDSRDPIAEARKLTANGWHVIPFIAGNITGLLTVEASSCNLAVGTLQVFLDNFIKNNTAVKIDYIHGDDVVTEIGSKPGNMGFYLPTMDKHDLFKTVILEGVLPRKTFSMGEAEEKRYYLECRKIR